MCNQAILYYVIRIMIVLAQTSNMPPIMKDMTVNCLSKLANEVWTYK